MEEKYETLKETDSENSDEEIYSKVVRAGRRTYFFDVKATRANDYYLTITESRKKLGRDGNPFYEKHKMHLYKEDFTKFSDGLSDVMAYVRKAMPEFFEEQQSRKFSQEPSSIDEEFERL